MFYSFPYLQAGFSHDEWDDVPRTDKVIVRDYFMNEGNCEQASLFGFYDTDRSVRGAIKKYDLHKRPFVQVTLASIHIPFSSPVGSPRYGARL